MTTFAIIGGAGYAARKYHGPAIHAVGGDLVAVCDVAESVGWVDEHWPRCRYVRGDGLRDDETRPDWWVICSPNARHHWQAMRGLLLGNVIVEKPLVVKSKNLAELGKVQELTGHRLSTILQLRHQAGALEAKAAVLEGGAPEEATVTYYAHRGRWYETTWKENPKISGGLIFNIGSHPVDLACWLYGDPGKPVVMEHGPGRLVVAGLFGETRVTFRLSTRTSPVVRQLQTPGAVYDLSESFGDLHARCYEQILAGEGPGISDVAPGVGFCEAVAKEVKR